MYSLLGLLFAGFIYAGFRWYRLVSLGVAEDRLDHPHCALLLALRDSFGQGNVIRETWGWMHYAFYVAFVGLFIGTTIVVINSDVRDLFDLFGLDLYFYNGDFYFYFKAAMDTFFLLLIPGVLMEGMRRSVRKPTVLNQPPADEGAGQFREPPRLLVPDVDDGADGGDGSDAGGRAHQRAHPAFTEWAYVGRVVGRIEGAMDAGATFHRWLWLVHVLFVYALLFCFPFTKLRHLIFGPLNLFFRNLGPRGRLAPIKDFESAEIVRRLASRAVHLETIARHGFVPRVRALHDQLPDRQHRQDAESEVSGDRTARASARKGALPARGQGKRTRRTPPPQRPHGTAQT